MLALNLEPGESLRLSHDQVNITLTVRRVFRRYAELTLEASPGEPPSILQLHNSRPACIPFCQGVMTHVHRLDFRTRRLRLGIAAPQSVVIQHDKNAA